MRIAFLHDWEVCHPQELSWKDGLASALRLLSKKHDVKLFVCGEATLIKHDYFTIEVTPEGDSLVDNIKAFNPDVILIWGDCTRPHAPLLQKLKIPMALCFAGGEPYGANYHCFSHIFVESDVYLKAFQKLGELTGITTSVAFGTNTELFKPVEKQKKIFDTGMAATYCDWKRYGLFTKSASGLSAWTAGWMYEDHERYCYEEPQDEGFLVLPHLSAEALRHLYAATKTLLVTSDRTGGSQRTVLEALSMNLPVLVMSDSDKTTEYVRGAGKEGWILPPDPKVIHEALMKDYGEVNTRKYVLENWSEFIYANALEEGLLKLCQK